MMNVIALVGRLVQDPELRYTQSGTAVGSFTLAVERPFTNREGERETDFIDIVVWRNLAETCANHLGKGRLVAVNGRLQIRSYDDRDGIRRKASEVVANDVRFLDWPDDRRGTGSAGKERAAAGRPAKGGGAEDGSSNGETEEFDDALDEFGDIDDDDLPF